MRAATTDPASVGHAAIVVFFTKCYHTQAAAEGARPLVGPDTIVASPRKTNRVTVAHEAVRFGGLGAEIAAQVQEHAFDHLDAPVARVAAPFSPVPFSPVLEASYVPDAVSIAAGIREVLARPGVAA